MGTFDTININNKDYQTKAFGKGLRTYHVGDKVTLIQAPFTKEEFDRYMFELSNNLPSTFVVNPQPESYSIDVIGIDYNTDETVTTSIIIENGKITDKFEKHSTYHYDSHGRLL